MSLFDGKPKLVWLLFPLYGLFAQLSFSQDSEKESQANFEIAKNRVSPELADPVRLKANGKVIDIGNLANAHAGPSLADIDGDGDLDLVVGDFPGHFWHFDNIGSDRSPKYHSRGKLATPKGDAKTPVY